MTHRLSSILLRESWNEDEQKYTIDPENTDCERFTGVTTMSDPWEGAVVHFRQDDDGNYVANDTVLRRTVVHVANRASHAQATVEAQQNNFAEALGNIGALMREAAIAQGWCGEYEEYRQRILDAVKYVAPVDAVNALRDNSDRRKKFSVTLEFMAKDAYSAQDFVYNLSQGYMDNASVTRHDVTSGDITPVVEDNDPDE